LAVKIWGGCLRAQPWDVGGNQWVGEAAGEALLMV
jgi:hypothetical protein